jgi:hypothetical protein
MTSDACPPAITTDQTEELRGFRAAFHRCFRRWADAGFELCEAMLCAPAPVGSVPSLSLEPCFRRSHGSLYKALDRGDIDAEAMRDLLVAHRPPGWPLVFAVDESTWARCDAETSPGRGFYYSASKHSAGQPIVAGWSYQWITQLDWANNSWTAPMDAARIPPGTDTVAATAAQIRDLVARLGPTEQTPTFVFNAGYDPIALTHELAEVNANLVVRIRDDRVFYTHPTEPEPGAIGRPRRHGERRCCAEPESWPTPDHESITTDDRYGTVHVAAWTTLHPKLGCRGHWRGFATPPIVSGTVVRVDVEHLPKPTSRTKKTLWLWVAGPEPDLEICWRAFPVRQEHPGLDHTLDTHPRTGRPLDLGDHRRLHPTPPGPRPRRRPPTALGTPPQARPAHPGTGSTRVSPHHANPGHPRQPTEIQKSRTRTPQRQPHRTTDPLPRHQEGRLNPARGLIAS